MKMPYSETKFEGRIGRARRRSEIMFSEAKRMFADRIYNGLDFVIPSIIALCFGQVGYFFLGTAGLLVFTAIGLAATVYLFFFTNFWFKPIDFTEHYGYRKRRKI